jgi:RNase H-fold protein (predicted Holliday junction resolvase)
LEEAKAASTDQTVDQMKRIGQSVQLAVTIQDPNLTADLTNQKLNAIIVKRQVIMLRNVGVQPRGLRRLQILRKKKRTKPLYY